MPRQPGELRGLQVKLALEAPHYPVTDGLLVAGPDQGLALSVDQLAAQTDERGKLHPKLTPAIGRASRDGIAFVP